MSWLKLLLGLITISFCTLLGYFAAGKYRSRKAFFTQLALFNERYLNELCYSRKPLSDFLVQYSYTGEFAKTVGRFSEDRTITVGYSFLSKEEQSFCTDYFDMLGKGDVRSQNEFFSAQNGVVSGKKDECEKEAKTRGELYLKLGLLAGLAFVILIV